MNKVIVIVGPTAVGKTSLSIELAKKYNGEIINADSTQVYKTLDIATAKITESEKEGIPHHLIDIKNIDEDYTVYDYQKDARKCIDDILRRGKTPILVGGTGLYIKAALYDYKFNLETTKGDYSKYTNVELYNMLLKLDPDTTIHINNRKRVERRLDYIKNNHTTETNKTDKLLYDAIFIGLTTDRDILYDRINKRVDIMIKNGLVEEAKRIYDSNIRTKAVLTPIGYKELFLFFDSAISLNEAIELIKQRSRRYAKRQYTWFNNQMNITWFTNFNDVYDYIEKRCN